MFKIYFKTAWRSLWKNKMNAFVSIIGLAIGTSAFLLLSTYILHEYRYDKFLPTADRIYRLNLFLQYGGGESVYTAVTPTALAPAIKRESSEVEEAVRIYNYSGGGPVSIQYRDKLFNERKFLFADQNFFKIFPFSFIEGNPSGALLQPNTVVITSSVQKKYFGNESAMGKIIRFGNDKDLVITGVMNDIPSYSQIQFDFLASYSSLARSKTERWNSANDFSYVLVKPGTQQQNLQATIDTLVKKHIGNDNGDLKLKFEAEPFTKVHLYSRASGGLTPNGNITYLYILSAIAILLLVIACINFINLVTARSAERAKEVGVRKVVGADRSQLFWQFMAECAVTTFTAMLLGLLITLLAFPFISRVTGQLLGLNVWQPVLLAGLLAIVFIGVTVLSGAYPAAFLSGFKPVKVLKGKLTIGGRGDILRRSLVVFQFSISILFIICTIVAVNQLRYIQHKSLGLDRTQLVVLDVGGISKQKLATLKSELLQSLGIKAVSASYDSPLDVQGGYGLSVQGKTDKEGMSITAIPVEKDFLKTLGMEIVSGADFTNTDIIEATMDSAALRKYAFAINEQAAKSIGWSAAEAIGKKVNLNGREGEIRAVVKDFHFRSLREAIAPIIIFPEYDYFGKILIKVSGNNIKNSLSGIEKIWKATFPLQPFEYHFLDEEFERMYTSEEKMANILGLFAGVTIFISCLGLFALVAFTAAKRTKEIGIRKVLGASVSNIVSMLSGEFLILVSIALLIASPLAWYFMHIWLQDFAYRIDIRLGIFVFAGCIAITIALVTVCFHAIKAAVANPVKSLRTE